MKKILVVDDDLTVTSGLNLVISKLGYEVVCFNSPIDAAREIEQRNYDLVISDINMPEASGMDLLLWIKKRHPNTKVAIITSEIDEKYPEIARLQNVVKFISKPLDFSNFKNIIEYCLKDMPNLSGSISTLSFMDFIQMIAFLNINKKIYITDSKNQTGSVYIKNGNVNHAEYNNKVGEEAFYEIIKNQNGSYYEKDYDEPESTTINKPISKLILNSARIKAENDIFESEKIDINKLKKDSKVLLLDSSDIFNQILIEKYLSKYDIQCDTADDYTDLMQILTKNKYNLVIVDMETIKNLDYGTILDMLLMNNKDSEILVFMDFNQDKSLINMTTKVNFIDKPINLKSLSSIITRVLSDEQSHEKVLGTVSNITFSDLIQLIGFDGKRRLIKVNDLTFDQKGLVCIQDGKILYASFNGLENEEAFYRILDIKSGLFNELKDNNIQIQEKNIGLINSLIMSYAEKKDNEEIKKNEMKKDGYIYSFSSLTIEKLLN